MSDRAAHPQQREASGATIGVVVIGRNEGQRLTDCLASIGQRIGSTVYVDSGSTDGSVSEAERLGAHAVTLDPSLPFTAARARNLGFGTLLARHPGIDLVQFVDGDCRIDPDWIGRASAFLAANPGVAVACGRRRERHPGASIYNRLCDWEWDTPVGPALACGGDALVRREAFEAVGGYDDAFIAGEEPEMCARLRKAGWTIARIDAEMTLHDAAMTRFGQWWRRAVRAGHGFAQVGARHPDCFVAERRRAWFWGAGLPAACLAALLVAPPLLLVPAVLYGLSFARVGYRFRRYGMNPADAAACAALITLSKLPNVQGMLIHAVRRLAGRRAELIEYK